MSIFPVVASIRRTCESRVVTKYDSWSFVGITAAIGPGNSSSVEAGWTGECARTANEIRPQLAFAEVVGADVAVYRACHDVREPDV